MTVSPQSDDWQDALTEGFSILLERPLDEFDQDASYAVYYSCTDLDGELFEEGFDVGVLARGEIVQTPFATIPILGRLLEGWDMIAPHWSIDLGQSFFYAGEPGTGAEFGVAELDTGLLGVDFGRILTERGLTPPDLREVYPAIEFRVHTDGTLLDAMRTATGAMRGPDHLFAYEPDWGADPEWYQRLAAVSHPGLRDHLRHLCRTEDSARSEGALYIGAKNPGFVPSRSVIAGWEIGEGQAWSGVVRLP